MAEQADASNAGRLGLKIKQRRERIIVSKDKEAKNSRPPVRMHVLL